MAVREYRWWQWRRGPKLGLVAVPGEEALRLPPQTMTALVILSANLIPLWGVLALDWAVLPLFLLFWLENVIIIGVNALRILLVRPGELALWPRKLLLVLGNFVRYGAFAAAHGGIIFKLFAPAEFPFLEAIDRFELWLPVAALAAWHLFVLLRFLRAGEHRYADLDEVFDMPLARLVLLHVVLLASGVMVQGFGAPAAALAVLVVLKAALEVGLHFGAVQVRTRR